MLSKVKQYCSPLNCFQNFFVVLQNEVCSVSHSFEHLADYLRL